MKQFFRIHSVDMIVEKRTQFESVGNAVENSISIQIGVTVGQRDTVRFTQRLDRRVVVALKRKRSK